MIDPIHRLKKLCTEQMEDLKGHITMGGAPDYASYTKAVGAVHALGMVLDEIQEIEKLLDDE